MLYSSLEKLHIKNMSAELNDLDDGLFNDTDKVVMPKYEQSFSAYPHFVSSGMSIGKYYIVSFLTKEEIERCNVNPVKCGARNRTWKVSEQDMILLKLGIDFNK